MDPPLSLPVVTSWKKPSSIRVIELANHYFVPVGGGSVPAVFGTEDFIVDSFFLAGIEYYPLF